MPALPRSLVRPFVSARLRLPAPLARLSSSSADAPAAPPAFTFDADRLPAPQGPLDDAGLSASWKGMRRFYSHVDVDGPVPWPAELAAAAVLAVGFFAVEWMLFWFLKRQKLFLKV